MVFEQADLGDPFGGFVPCIEAIGHRIHPRLRGANAHLHVHEFVADDLALDQGRAKSFALACPVQRFVVAGLGKAQSHGAHAQALAVEIGHDDFEATALFAQ